MTEVALDIQAEVSRSGTRSKGCRPTSEGTAPVGEQVLVELSRPGDCCGSATAEETAAFGQWLVASAQAAADAAKEGGFRVRRGAGQQRREGDAGPGARGGLTGLTGADAKSIRSTRAYQAGPSSPAACVEVTLSAVSRSIS